VNLPERDALQTFLETDTPLKRALEAFRDSQQSRYEADCAGYMATVPRDPERAADAAAKADAYKALWIELDYFSEHAK